MLDRLRAHLDETGMIPSGCRVVVAYSGGADSTCLLHLLHELGMDVVAAHLHHGMRPEADDEMTQSQAFCDQLGVPLATGRANIYELAEAHKVGVEEAGRMARQNFLRQVAFRVEADRIATGHTRDDHIETILFHLVRGTGLSGLTGIHADRDGLIRPLLIFTREETRAYCKERGFWFHDDPANGDLNFSRARIRHKVVPELRLVHPGADESIVRLSEIAQEEDDFLNRAAAAGLEHAELPQNGELAFLTQDVELAYRRDVLSALPPVLLKRGLRLAGRVLGANLSFDQTHLLTEGISEGHQGSVTAEGGEVAVTWNESTVHFERLNATVPFRYPLTVPGETDSEEFGWSFQAHLAPAEITNERASLKATLLASEIKGPLHFRTWKEGDKLIPLGGTGHRLLSDLFGEAGLTALARRRLPIVCDIQGPIWAPGVCLAERVGRVQPGESAFLLQFGPLLDLPGHNRG
jgi:tRNA(Ile)-lysidine synthase